MSQVTLQKKKNKNKKKKNHTRNKIEKIVYNIFMFILDDDKGRAEALDETEIRKFSPPATQDLASTEAYSDEDREIDDSDVEEVSILLYICMNWGCFIV